MGKGRRGPCSHCGTTHTPMWRNGPPHKPILCNACGSRWRIWGNLTDYVPKHANASMINRIKNAQRSQQGNLLLSIQDSEDRKPKVRDNIASSSAGLKDDASNGSAPESAVSPNGHIQLETTNGKEDSGSVQQSFWNPCIPRKKRSGLQQCTQSPVESFRRQLYNILQKPEFSKILSEEDDMLIFQNSQTSANEIGLGCVLLKSTASE